VKGDYLPPGSANGDPRDPFALPGPLPSHRPFIELLPASVRRRPEAARPHWLLASALLAVTFLTTTTLGAVWILWAHPTDTTEAFPWLSPHTISYVWSNPSLIALGLSFSLPALLILLSHEMGHYLACRYYGLPATLPYFLPLPVGIGTLGAFIRIRSPIRNRRQLFDVGVAGPLAGFVVLLPFLLIGVARSEVVTVQLADEATLAAAPAQVPALLVPGRSLALEAASRWFHGPLPANAVLHLHPFALAAWFGLLVTALNLLPLGQLDGGHILYAAAGNLQRRLAWPLWIGLAVMAFFSLGWVLWLLIVLLMGLRHPPVAEETERLDPWRMALAWVALVVFVLSFMPVPLRELLLMP
jgi:membrane-associated protease RseP (regulator of RpoE activity)